MKPMWPALSTPQRSLSTTAMDSDSLPVVANEYLTLENLYTLAALAPAKELSFGACSRN